VRQRLLAGDASSLKDNGDMIRTIAIAVCSAVAYLAIIIGLTVYCSIRLIRAAALRKHPPRHAAAVHGQFPLQFFHSSSSNPYIILSICRFAVNCMSFCYNVLLNLGVHSQPDGAVHLLKVLIRQSRPHNQRL